LGLIPTTGPIGAVMGPASPTVTAMGVTTGAGEDAE